MGLKKDNHHRTNALLDSDTLKTYDLTGHDDVFNYLTRIQDEVHRFVITYHKTIRSKGMLKSMLSNVEGLGTQRINNLLKNGEFYTFPYFMTFLLKRYLNEN